MLTITIISRMLFTVFIMQRLTSLPQLWFFQCFGPGSGTSLASGAPTADQTQRSENWIPHHQSCSASGRSWGNQIQQRSWHGRPGSLERQKWTWTKCHFVLHIKKLQLHPLFYVFVYACMLYILLVLLLYFISLISWSTSQKHLKLSTASMGRSEEVSSSQQITSKARRVLLCLLLSIFTAVVI